MFNGTPKVLKQHRRSVNDLHWPPLHQIHIREGINMSYIISGIEGCH